MINSVPCFLFPPVISSENTLEYSLLLYINGGRQSLSQDVVQAEGESSTAINSTAAARCVVVIVVDRYTVHNI
eukprot:scaffold10254_cov36-Attheya_sp.AAC.1